MQSDGYYNLLDSITYSEEAVETMRLRKLMQNSINGVEKQIQSLLEEQNAIKTFTTKKCVRNQNNFKDVSFLEPALESAGAINYQSARYHTLQRLHSSLNASKVKKQIVLNEKRSAYFPCAIPLAPPEIRNRNLDIDNNLEKIQQPENHSSSRTNENVSLLTCRKEPKRTLSIKVLPSIDIEGTRLPYNNVGLMETKTECCDCETLHIIDSAGEKKVLCSVATNTENLFLNRNFADAGNSSLCHSDHRIFEFHKFPCSPVEMINKSTQASSMPSSEVLSKCVQVSLEGSHHTKTDVRVDTKRDADSPNNGFPTSNAACNFMDNGKQVKENEYENIQHRQDFQSSGISEEFLSVFKLVYDNYKKNRTSSSVDSVPQNETSQKVITRDVSIQINPPLSCCKSTMTTNIKMQHCDSQCDDLLHLPPVSSKCIESDCIFGKANDIGTQTQTCEEAVMTKHDLLLDIGTQIERILLNVSTQTAELQISGHPNNFQYSATNTSVSSATMSDSEFVDDLLSEGEVHLPWNLRLLSALDKNAISVNSVLNTEKNDTSNQEFDDYSLSEGEIHPKYFSHAEAPLQQNDHLNNGKYDKLIATLENRLASLSRLTERRVSSNYNDCRQQQCTKPMESENLLSEEEFSSQSLSPGEVMLKPASFIPSHQASSLEFLVPENMHLMPSVTPTNKDIFPSDTSATKENLSDEGLPKSSLEVNNEQERHIIQSNDSSFRSASRAPLQTVLEEELFSS